ncbi:alpha/beta hydrolase family protein [Kitasatospora sp. NPDC092948]|uniref:alpha/beta hydrolase family protein n=1 Tax=Kitasatospora sp. NPDC092948 TaxID=3364088 RepID=UPI00380C9D68
MGGRRRTTHRTALPGLITLLLADDALAALRLLRARPEVDPARVGLWGLSEGAWVVTLAAGRASDVSFVVTAGASGLGPARQQACADYDPLPAWEQLRVPVPVEWGTLDREAVPAESERIVRDALDRAGNRHYTIRTVPDVRHNLRRSFADGSTDPSNCRTTTPTSSPTGSPAWPPRCRRCRWTPPPSSSTPAGRSPRSPGTSRPGSRPGRPSSA